MRILKALIRLIKDQIRKDREKNELNGLYVDNDIPRALGTRIRRYSNDSK